MDPRPRSSGYSGTPLANKLGIRPGFRVFVADPPAEYESLLAPLPPEVTFTRRRGPAVDLAHVFTSDRTWLARELGRLRTRLLPTTPVWVSWPKKASGRPTTVTEDTIRDVALPLGFVDVKVCAVSDVWSGLKLVVRRELR